MLVQLLVVMMEMRESRPSWSRISWHHGNEKYQQIAFEHSVSFSLLFSGEQAFFTGYRSMSSSTGQWSEPKISLWISAARILSAMRRDTIK